MERRWGPGEHLMQRVGYMGVLIQVFQEIKRQELEHSSSERNEVRNENGESEPGVVRKPM